MVGVIVTNQLEPELSTFAPRHSKPSNESAIPASESSEHAEDSESESAGRLGDAYAFRAASSVFQQEVNWAQLEAAQEKDVERLIKNINRVPRHYSSGLLKSIARGLRVY